MNRYFLRFWRRFVFQIGFQELAEQQECFVTSVNPFQSRRPTDASSVSVLPNLYNGFSLVTISLEEIQPSTLECEWMFS